MELNQMSEWELIQFKPIQYCNTYSLHVVWTDFAKLPKVIAVADISGKVHFMGSSCIADLRPLIDDLRTETCDGSIELVASDMTVIQKADSDDHELYIATCWVVYDDDFVPESYFAAFFHCNDDNIPTLWKKVPLANAPTFCKLNQTSPILSDAMHMLIFSHSVGAQAYSVDPVCRSVDLVESIGDVFPVLEISTMPGAATRSHCWIVNDNRFSVVGFDTGYVVASVCTMKSGTILDRRSIKFSGPISVLKLIDMNEEAFETAVLISSTIGPAVIWTLGLEDDLLKWQIKCELVGSELCDCVISGNTNHDYIFIGTYTEQILIYDLKTALKSIRAPVIAQVMVGSPVLSIMYIPADDSIVVLSYKGFHKFVQPKGRTFEQIAHRAASIEAVTREPSQKNGLPSFNPIG